MNATPPHAVLYLDEDMPRSGSQRVAGGVAEVYSSRRPGPESRNQDGAAIISCSPTTGVLAVADGVGGSRAGHAAASRALEALCEALVRRAEPTRPLRSAILDGFEAASEAVRTLGVGAATTLSVVEIDGASIRPYHAGDSPILVVGQRGKVKLQIVPHSPVGFAVEAGLLHQEDAIHHEDLHLVSNVVGEADMRIEIGPWINLAPRDRLLISSDGLTDNLHLFEIIEQLRCGPLPATAQSLAKSAEARMSAPESGEPSKPDDLTFLIYRLEPRPLTDTPPTQ